MIAKHNGESLSIKCSPRNFRGGAYYDTQSLENVLKAECLLTSEMNGNPLPEVCRAPLGLRVENQLGYKMVKWIERIEFIDSETSVGLGIPHYDRPLMSTPVEACGPGGRNVIRFVAKRKLDFAAKRNSSRGVTGVQYLADLTSKKGHKTLSF
jgi:DMSO/TMAO reductase YedYZ molybdopterin-dependent catalytic subunit